MCDILSSPNYPYLNTFKCVSLDPLDKVFKQIGPDIDNWLKENKRQLGPEHTSTAMDSLYSTVRFYISEQITLYFRPSVQPFEIAQLINVLENFFQKSIYNMELLPFGNYL